MGIMEIMYKYNRLYASLDDKRQKELNHDDYIACPARKVMLNHYWQIEYMWRGII